MRVAHLALVCAGLMLATAVPLCQDIKRCKRGLRCDRPWFQTNCAKTCGQCTTNAPANAPTNALSWEYENKPPDLSHCNSEGGSVNCASCSPGSECRKVFDHLKQYGESVHDQCTDVFPNDFVAMKTFVLYRDKKWTGKGKNAKSSSKPRRQCRNLHRDRNMEFGFQSDNFFLLKDSKDSPYMITKFMYGHPNRASLNVGGIGLKRVLMHKHSKTKEWVADVERQAVCINCTSNIFEHEYASKATNEELEQLYDCAKGAFNKTNGLLKASYECSDEDSKHFLPMGLTF